MTIAENLAEVRAGIQEAVRLSSRRSEEVSLLAVSKTYPAEVVAEVLLEGQLMLGENRVQEALEKMPLLPSEVQWHLIGPLQRNKVRKVVGSFACLQGVDSLKLASAISRVAAESDSVQQILLQVKVGAEETKSGFEEEALLRDFEDLIALPGLQVAGLMTIPPPVQVAEEARPYFAVVRELRDRLAQASGLPLTELSMGMSGDYQAAIAEGSTLVRVGSAIFGKRE